jgi:Zn-dependent metalloprotease
MKKSNLFFISLFFFYASDSISQILTGKEANAKIEGAKMIEYSERSNRPVFIEFADPITYSRAVSDPAIVIKKLLGFTQQEDLKPYRQELDDLGFTHTRYQQYYKNVPVEGGEYIAHEKSSGLDCINGVVFKIKEMDVKPFYSDAMALNKALVYVGAKKYKWENLAEINQLREIFGKPDFNYDPKAELVIYPVNNEFSDAANFRLAYKFDIYAEEPESRAYVFVDAQTGEILGKQELIHTADTKGSAATKYSGTREITTDQVSSTSYRLRETGRGNGIETWNVKTATSTTSRIDFTDADNNWNNVNTAKDEAATDAHWATEMTYDYYKNVHNRNSIDNQGFKLLNYVHWDVNWFNASWNGQYMRYGDGNGKPLTALDIGGHEMTHGLTSNTAKLVYQDESGGLNESFSDIFGTAVEFFAKTTSANWDIGEDVGALRSMSNPKSHSNPDTYKGQYWVAAGGSDNGGVHTNSGVQNHWFYILTKGESSSNDNNVTYNVGGIGIDKASKIAFRNLTVYLTSSSTYANARTYALKAATDLYGNCSPEYIATGDAWWAVGVGTKISCAVAPVADFTASNTSPCDGVVQFTDQSDNAPTSWSWDFGDSKTSTLQNPSHTYTSSGTYSVILKATNANGNDSETKTSYITINLLSSPVVTDAARCSAGIVNLSASGSGGNLQWYTTSTGGTPINTGTTYGPNLSATTTFYVENSTAKTAVKAGPVNNAFGTNALFTANDIHGLLFDVLVPCRLKTVKVYAGAAGNRTIEVLDAFGGTVINTKVVNIPAGESRITLDFDFPAGSQYFIKVTGTTIDLSRNNGSATYPYTVAGLVSITETDVASTNPGYYYFFYDWEIQETGCTSARVPVTGTINTSPAKPVITQNGSVLSAPAGFTYQWYLNGALISGATAQTYTATGSGNYSVEITNAKGCSSTSVDYYFSGTGITDLAKSGLTVYPNPAGNDLFIKIPGAINKEIHLSLYDLLGKIVYSETFVSTQEPKHINLAAQTNGVYFLRLQDDASISIQKITIEH